MPEDIGSKNLAGAMYAWNDLFFYLLNAHDYDKIREKKYI